MITRFAGHLSSHIVRNVLKSSTTIVLVVMELFKENLLNMTVMVIHSAVTVMKITMMMTVLITHLYLNQIVNWS